MIRTESVEQFLDLPTTDLGGAVKEEIRGRMGEVAKAGEFHGWALLCVMGSNALTRAFHEALKEGRIQ